MGAYAGVVEAILAIAPGAESHAAIWIGIDDAMCPVWRHDDFVSGAGRHGDAASGLVFGELLRVDDGVAAPDFKNLGRGPTTMGRNRVDVALRADRLAA